jgi:hypothetical protein
MGLYKTRTGSFKAALGFLEMTIPDKPRSKKHRYCTTPAGRAVLEKRAKEAEA